MDVADRKDDRQVKITREYLDALLEKARVAASTRAQSTHKPSSDTNDFEDGTDHVLLLDDSNRKNQPKSSDTTEGNGSNTRQSVVDPALVVPAALDQDKSKKQNVRKLDQSNLDDIPQPPMSKKQKREAAAAKKLAESHFNLPAPTLTPELKREIQALRLHASMDPKRFLRGEAKRDNKSMPEHFQIGYLVDDGGSSSSSNRISNAGPGSHGRVQRKGFIEALVEDEEAKAYAKKKYLEAQSRTMSGTGGKWKNKKKKRR